MIFCGTVYSVSDSSRLLQLPNCRSVYSGHAVDVAATQCCLPADGRYLQITVHGTWKPKNGFVPLTVVT